MQARLSIAVTYLILVGRFHRGTPVPRFQSKLKDMWLAMSEHQRKTVARKAGTTPLYIHKLSGGHCLPSLPKAMALKHAFPGLTDEDLMDAWHRRQAINAQKRSR